jgi:hypothetical protein
MHLFQGTGADPHTEAVGPDWVDPALIRFADECSATFGRLILYVGFLALFAIGGVQLWDRLPETIENDPAIAASWAAASRWFPALTISQPELIDKTSAYEIVQPANDGRADIPPRVGSGTTSRADTHAASWLGGTENPGLRGGL